MHLRKRIIVTLLTILVVLGMMPISAFAEDNAETRSGEDEYDFYEIETELVYRGTVVNHVGDVVLTSSNNGIIKKGERLYGGKDGLLMTPSMDWNVSGYRMVAAEMNGRALQEGRTYRMSQERGEDPGRYKMTVYLEDAATVYELKQDDQITGGSVSFKHDLGDGRLITVHRQAAGLPLYVQAFPENGYSVTGVNLRGETSGNVYEAWVADVGSNFTTYVLDMPAENLLITPCFFPENQVHRVHIFGVAGKAELDISTMQAKTGDTVTVKADVMSGWKVSEYYYKLGSENGQETRIPINSGGNAASFTMPDGDIWLYPEVDMADDWHNVYGTIYGSGEVKVEPIQNTAREGDTVKLRVTLDEGYKLKRLYYKEYQGSGEGIDIPLIEGETEYSFIMPNYDTIIYFEVYAPSWVQVSFVLNGQEVPNNNQIEYSLTSSNGNLWEYSTGYAIQDGAKITFNASDTSEVYTLEKAELIISGGTFKKEIIPGKEFIMKEPEYPRDSRYRLVLYIATKGGFYPVYKGGSSSFGRLIVKDSEGKEITAQKAGEYVDVRVVPRDGWKPSRVLVVRGDGIAFTASNNALAPNLFTFTMPDVEVVVKADYVRESSGVNEGHSLTFVHDTSQGGGILREANNRTKAPARDGVNLMVYPQEGWLIDTLTVTDSTNNRSVSIDNQYELSDNGICASFLMPNGDVIIEATYKLDSAGGYSEIIATGGEHGTIGLRTVRSTYVIEGSNTTIKMQAKKGERIILIITPDKGYEVANVICGVDAYDAVYDWPSEKRYYTMPEGDMRISVRFRETMLRKVTVADVDNGFVGTIPEKGCPGDRIGIVCNPDAGYYIKNLQVMTESGVEVEVSPGYSFLMPAEDVTVIATFEESKEKPSVRDGVSLNAGVVGEEYRYVLNIANGSTYIDVFQGSLPDGLRVTETGTIHGTPTKAGAFTAMLSVKNAKGEALQPCIIMIADKAYNYSAYASPTEGGTVSIEPVDRGVTTADGRIMSGREVYLRERTNTGYRFVGWFVGDTKISDESTAKYNINENTVIVAHYVTDTLYPVDIKSRNDTMGSVTLKKNGELVDSPQYMGGSDSFIAEAIPAEGHRFKQWAEDNTLPNPFSVDSVIGQYHLTAIFEPKILTNLEITNEPNKTEYLVGETFDPDGMLVTATMDDGSQEEVTAYTISPDGELSVDDKEIIINYTLNGVTMTATQSITVEKRKQTIIIDKTNLLELVYEDGPVTLELLEDGDGMGGITWESSDSEVMSIQGNTATIIKPGTVTITATKAGDDTYEEAVDTLEVTIGKKVLLVDVDLEPIYYGQTLKDTNPKANDLRVSCSWDDPSIVPNVSSVDTYECKLSLLDQWKDYYSLDKDTFVTTIVVMPTEPIVEVTATKTSDTTAMLKATIHSAGKGLAPKGYIELGYSTEGSAYVDIDRLALTPSDDGSYSYAEAEWIIPDVEVEYRIGAVYDNEGENNYRESKAKAISFDPRKINQGEVKVAASSDELVYGDELSFTASGGSGSGRVTFESSDPNTVSVNKETGVATILKSGQVIITATKAADLTYNEEKGVMSITVKKAELIFVANDKYMLQNEPLPSLTYTVCGLMNGDVLQNEPRLSVEADGATPGIFDISIAGGEVETAGGAAWTNCYDVEYLAGRLNVEVLPTYTHITGGEDLTWTKGSPENLVFTFKRSENDEDTIKFFAGIAVDGEDVDRSQYDVESGSVIIKLKPEYLETLTEEDHDLLVRFEDGESKAKFAIKAASPGGDTSGGDTHGEDTPGGDTPTEEEPSEATPGKDTPSEEKPTDETPGEDKKTEETTAKDKAEEATSAAHTGDDNNIAIWLLTLVVTSSVIGLLSARCLQVRRERRK